MMTTETKKTFTMRPKNHFYNTIEDLSENKTIGFVNVISLNDCYSSLENIAASALRNDVKSIEEILVELKHLGVIREK